MGKFKRFHIFRGGEKGQSLLKFIALFQVKSNFCIENNFFRVVSRHQKYTDL